MNRVWPSCLRRVRLMADRGPQDAGLPATMALKKTLCQDEDRLALARNEVAVLRRLREAACPGREFIVQYFSHQELRREGAWEAGLRCWSWRQELKARQTCGRAR